MAKYSVYGMTCAACSARVEKAVKSVDGVLECSVNLLTNSMEVKGSAKNEEIINAVKASGYNATVFGNKDNLSNLNQAKNDNGFKSFLISVIVLLALMYVSMGHIMWGWYMPRVLSTNSLSLALTEFILSSVILIINGRFFKNGFKAVINRSPNMDTLVALGSGVSYIYSIYILFLISHYTNVGNHHHALHNLHGLYFESAAMILVLITVGKLLEARSKGKTTTALNSLINLAPKKANVINGDSEILVNAQDVKIGDIIAVRPGESFAADGIIIEGEGSVDESALTGESIPADKKIGDKVHTATVNRFGFFKVKVTHTGEDTYLSKIIKMVSDASASKAPIAKIADKVSGVFVPIVIAIAVLSALIWLVLGKSVGFSIARGISVLVISCPCALGLATPVAIMVATGLGAKHGILFKSARALENLCKTNVVVFDKTGTLTQGTPFVTDIVPINCKTPNELLKIAYSLEIKSEHPLAKAINQKALELEIVPAETLNFKVLPGNGLSGVINNEELYAGSYNFIKNKCKSISQATDNKNADLASEGKTPIYFASKDVLYGIIAVADDLKQDAVQTINTLNQMNIETVMLTGDNESTALKIAQKAGIKKVIASVLPDGKVNEISKLKSSSFVTMVGDGINDAPALTTADIGIAVAKGTEIAIDAADVVLLKDSLKDIPAAITLSKAALKNIKQNLFWAFIYNIIGIPLAAGAFINAFGWQLTPMFGAAAMSISSFCVVSNALRINFVNIYKHKKLKSNYKKEKKTMEKTIKIEGMMCPHCEARVKQLLEEIDGVTSAVTSHKDGTAVVTLNKDVADHVFAKVITDAGYKVI